MLVSKSIKDKIISSFNKISYFSDKILIICIFCFSFFVSFNPSIGKTLINNMFYLWLLSLNFKHIVYYIKNNKVFLWIIILFAWISFTVLITDSTNYYNYDNFIKYFLLPILIIVTTIKKEYIKYIISVFILGLFINELISYGIYFGFIKSSFLGFKIVGNELNPVPFLTSHIEYTTFLSFGIIVSLFSFFKVQNRYLKLILLIFVVTMTTNMFLTIGRTGQFTLLGTLIFLIIIYFKNNIKHILGSLFIITVVFVLFFNFSSNTNKRLKQGFNDIEKVLVDKNYNTSWGIRLTSYIIIPDIIKDKNFNIFYGIGYCKVDDIIQEIHIKKFGDENKFAKTYGHLHNTYITIFSGLGFIGFIVFIMIWYYLFSSKITDKYLNFIRYSFLFVLFLGGFSSQLFWQREVMLLSAIFISIIIYTSTKETNKEIIKNG